MGLKFVLVLRSDTEEGKIIRDWIYVTHARYMTAVLITSRTRADA